MDISIIIPAYNVEQYLSEALDSVFAQIFHGNFEVLVANDASTDSTLDIVESYVLNYPNRIKVLNRTDNKGVSANYADLAHMSNAKYLAFLDADDYWTDSHKLQRQYDYLESHPEVGMVCAAANMIDEKGTYMKRVDVEYATSLLSLLESNEDIFCSNVMCRRELFLCMIYECAWYIERNWFYDTIWSYWFAAHSSIAYMPEVLSAYRVSEDSDSHSSTPERSYQLVKRNYMIKMHFILTHSIDENDAEHILEKEYDYMRNLSFNEGINKIRNTKTYRWARKFLNIFNHHD